MINMHLHVLYDFYLLTKVIVNTNALIKANYKNLTYIYVYNANVII